MSLPDLTNTVHAFPPHPKTAFAHVEDHDPDQEHEHDADHPLVRAANLTPRQRNAVLGAQVRFFIEASESVETDEETIRDILGALGEIVEDVDLEDGDGDLGEPSGAVAFPDDEDDEDKDDGEVEINTNFRDEDVRIGAGWGKQEVRRMLYHLKHHGMERSLVIQVQCMEAYHSVSITLGMSSFVKEYVSNRAIPIPELLCAFGLLLADELQTKKPGTLLYFLRVALYRELQLREKLPQYNTIDDAVNLIASSRRILILTGAGISVSCGIPDFRSRNGLYATLKDSGEYDLDDPQQMFDIEYFREHPNGEILPSILLKTRGSCYGHSRDTRRRAHGPAMPRLLRNRICVQCRTRVAGKEIETEILRGEIPLCKICNAAAAKKSKPRRKSRGKRRNNDDEDEEDEPPFPPGIMKPDITFFGEKLTDDFDYALAKDRQSVDLILVIGTSLKVSPVSDILTHMPHSVPQILINKTPVKHINPDIVLLGNADAIVEYLCAQLGWELPPHTPPSAGLQPPAYPVRKKRRSQEPATFTPQRVGNSHVWLFEGADGGKWVEDLETEQAAAALAALHVPSMSSSQSSLASQSSSKNESHGKKKARVS
ncbi:hypothetical protein EVG20_g558 [Dentipellis fragilis]|uniref:Deacetylase sirtuin-type domain-containing protein n=1 Tax=Dentipellis fragilis TaxID=205917 RepID=A0A4Y9ZF63_9AGAM|nr:hypothetical protein EVG20_g558 [Dentipellis fragilis]